MPCSRIQRRRAWATSARFCSAAYRVFFEADVASVVEPPNRAAAARDAALVHRRNDLVQRQVRLLGDEREQEFRVLFQRRSASATWLCGNASGCFEALRPNHHHTGADPIVFGRRTPRCTADNVSDYSGTQVAGIRLGHGIPRHRIKDKRLPHWQAVGNPSDSSRAKFALAPARGSVPRSRRDAVPGTALIGSLFSRPCMEWAKRASEVRSLAGPQAHACQCDPRSHGPFGFAHGGGCLWITGTIPRILAGARRCPILTGHRIITAWPHALSAPISR
jgi:hypothetical protein